MNLQPEISSPNPRKNPVSTKFRIVPSRYLLPRNRIKGSSNLQKDSSTKNGNVNNSTNRNTFTKLRKTASSKGPYKKTGATLIPPIVHTPATSTKVRMVVPPAPVVSTKTCVSSVVRNHPNQNQYISQNTRRINDNSSVIKRKSISILNSLSEKKSKINVSSSTPSTTSKQQVENDILLDSAADDKLDIISWKICSIQSDIKYLEQKTDLQSELQLLSDTYTRMYDEYQSANRKLDLLKQIKGLHAFLLQNSELLLQVHECISDMSNNYLDFMGVLTRTFDILSIPNVDLSETESLLMQLDNLLQICKSLLLKPEDHNTSTFIKIFNLAKLLNKQTKDMANESALLKEAEGLCDPVYSNTLLKLSMYFRTLHKQSS